MPHRGMQQDEDSPLPPGWTEEFVGRADLEASYQSLESCDHFHAATMRGRIRTLQLRIEEAWDHLDEADLQSRLAVETIPNLMRVFLLQVYRFENAMLERPEPLEPEFPEPRPGLRH